MFDQNLEEVLLMLTKDIDENEEASHPEVEAATEKPSARITKPIPRDTGAKTTDKTPESTPDSTVPQEEEVIEGREAAMAEYAILMKQWDFLVADYERREAEEQAEKAAENDAGKAE